MGSVWIAGSYQSDFARNYAREGLEISDMVAEAVEGTLASAGLEPEDVESIHVGNAFGAQFTYSGWSMFGTIPTSKAAGQWDIYIFAYDTIAGRFVQSAKWRL